jgi:hypothetical protein
VSKGLGFAFQDGEYADLQHPRSPVTVAERHGHARATMTLDRYAHALPERDREAAGVLESVLTFD